MSAAAVTFTDAIRAYGRNNGLNLSAEHVGILDSVLKSLGRIEGDHVMFDMGNDVEGTFEEILARETEGAPRIGVQTAEKIDPAGLNPTQYAVARNRAVREGRSAAAVSTITSAGNPWAKETWSRTHQALVTNANPTLATQLKASAGI